MSTDIETADRAIPPGVVDEGGLQTVSLVDLIHPGERPRFWVAVAAAILILGIPIVGIAHFGGWVMLALVGVGIVVLWVATWLGLQIVRARLLGRNLRVTERSLPNLADVIDQQRARLAFTKRVDFYVANEVDGSIRYSSYFGTKIVIIKGDLVAELDVAERRVQAVFLIGSVLGHLAVKHQRFTPVSQIIEAISNIKIFNFALSPYLRCAWYTGDNIGLYLCGDPSLGVHAIHRQFVGKDLSPAINASGIIGQADEVRRKALPRLVSLFSDEPHLTDRYLNVLRFLHHAFPEDAQRWRDGLDSYSGALVDRQLSRSPYSRDPAGRRSPIFPMLAAASVGVVAVVGLLFPPGNPVQDDAFSSPTDSGIVQPDQPGTSEAPVPTTPPTTPTPPAQTDSLPQTSAPTDSVPQTAAPAAGPTGTGLNWVNDGQCVQHAFGQVAEFLSQAGCQRLERTVIATQVDGQPALISVALLDLDNQSDNTGFISLITANGTGDIRTLVDDGIYQAGPASFASDPTFLAQTAKGTTTIEVLEAMWLNKPTAANDPALAPALTSFAARLEP